MPPSRVAVGAAESSSRSDIFFQGDGRSLNARNSPLTSNCGSSLHSIPGHAGANMGPISGDVNNAALNNVAGSVPRAGVNYLVTGSNSGRSGSPNMQRNASFNSDSQILIPTSPMSFTSNSMDGPFAVQHRSNQDFGSQAQQNRDNQGTSSSASLPISRVGQVQLPNGPRGSSHFIQDPFCISHLQKKARMDIKQEDILQQQVFQHLLQRQDPAHLQNSNPQFQALIQQQRLRQQQQREQQHVQYMPPMQRIQLLQQHQQQLRQQHLVQQGLQPSLGIKRPHDGGVCSRRIMQYLYHQRQRPSDNDLPYWRKFVAEYYSSCAKKKWCLSLYDNVVGVFPQPGDAWQCDLCGSRPGRGFEAPFGGLATLYQTKFNSGVVDELVFLGLPRESQLPSGMMMLECPKAVQESVYEQVRVVHEGQLRIIFTSDLKILSWEFCPRQHEEFLPRRLVAPQVNRLVQLAQNCQEKISESEPDGRRQSDLQTQNATVVAAGRQLARTLEVQFLNEWGISKRFGRFIQIVDVVNSMKDLMDFCNETKAGPIDGLKNFPRRSPPNIQIPKMEPVSDSQDLQISQMTRITPNNKMMASNHGISTRANNNQHMGRQGAVSGSAQAAVSLTNYQNQMMRQHSMNATRNSSTQQEASSSPFGTTSSAPATPTGPSGISSGALHNSPAVDFSRHHHAVSVQGSQPLQQQQPRMQQMMLQDTSIKNYGPSGPQHSLSQQSQDGNTSRDGLGCKKAPSENLVRQPMATTAESPAAAVNNVYSGKGADTPDDDLCLPDEFVSDVAHEFAENGFFDELDASFWKA